MKRKLHKINLPLFTERIILCCSFLLLLNCNSNNRFQRETSIIDNWQHSKPVQSKANTITYSKELSIDFQHDKIYLLQLSPIKNLLHARLNNTLITGTLAKDNAIHFNLTEHLTEQNNFELTYSGETDFSANIHCVNKLFIPDIYLEISDSGQVLVEVKIKNAFNTEKQGILEYALYTDKKKIQTKETPVFIAGNAENLYRQHVNINHLDRNFDGLKVVCHLYSEGKLFDSNTDNWQLTYHASTAGIDYLFNANYHLQPLSAHFTTLSKQLKELCLYHERRKIALFYAIDSMKNKTDNN